MTQPALCRLGASPTRPAEQLTCELEKVVASPPINLEARHRSGRETGNEDGPHLVVVAGQGDEGSVRHRQRSPSCAQATSGRRPGAAMERNSGTPTKIVSRNGQKSVAR